MIIKFIKENWFKIIIAFCAVVLTMSYFISVGVEREKENRIYNESQKSGLPGLPRLP
jgi:hypothetical protein